MNGSNSDAFKDTKPKHEVGIVTHGLSDRGNVRDSNQDQFLIGTLRPCVHAASSSLGAEGSHPFFGEKQSDILIVADGMGGHAAGERASQLAVEYLVQRLAEQSWPSTAPDVADPSEHEEWLQGVLRDTHLQILQEAESHPERFGMGTTLTMAEIVWPRMSVLHAGDSRCYLIRDGVPIRLTTDHTLARRMVESGDLNHEDEPESRWSNVLWNVLGGRLEGELVAQVETVELHLGDVVVLCSDGLYRYVGDELLASIISEEGDSQSICRELVRVANAAGGEDNITVIVAQMLLDTGDETGRTAIQEETVVEETYGSIEVDDGTLAMLSEFDTTIDRSSST